MSARLAVAVVGCGKVADFYHLPVLAGFDGVEIEALVDPARDRAEALADEYGGRRVLEDHRELPETVDAAVVAVPNHLHAGVCRDLLEQGVHVLVEKPMAIDTAGCDEMIAAAETSGSVVAVGHQMRFFPAVRFVKRVLERGWLGPVRRFDLRNGRPLQWDAESGFLHRRDAAGGGVLIDLGVHVLDLLLWWLGPCRRVDYRDDARGGVEANCRLRLAMESGVEGTVELSRERDLRNTCVFECEDGLLEVGTYGHEPQIRLETPDGRGALSGLVERERRSERDPLDAHRAQLRSFLGAIAGGRSDGVTGVDGGRSHHVTGREGRRCVELVGRCYASRQRLDQPWRWPASAVETGVPEAMVKA